MSCASAAGIRSPSGRQAWPTSTSANRSATSRSTVVTPATTTAGSAPGPTQRKSPRSVPRNPPRQGRQPMSGLPRCRCNRVATACCSPKPPRPGQSAVCCRRCAGSTSRSTITTSRSAGRFPRWARARSFPTASAPPAILGFPQAIPIASASSATRRAGISCC